MKMSLTSTSYSFVKERESICSGCQLNSKNYLKTKTKRFHHCVACKCNIWLKVANPKSECGISELNKKNRESGLTEIKLKWKAITNAN